MKIYLCFCPSADPAMPHASLPALGAGLKEAGYGDYFLRDLNLDTFLYFLDEERLDVAVLGVKERLKHNDFKSEALREEADRLTADQGLPARLASSIKSCRDESRFYSIRDFLRQKQDFRDGCRLISLQYEGIRFEKYSLYDDFPYDSFDDIRTALDHQGTAMLIEFYRHSILPEIRHAQPHLLGISVAFFSQLIPSFVLAQKVRRVSPGTHIILGGPVVTWGQEILVRYAQEFSTLIDSFCLGEGEHCITTLAEKLDNNEELSGVPNLVFYRDGKAVINPPEEADIDLWELATPDYKAMPLDGYMAPQRIISVPLTKGCYYNKCRFCNYAFIKMTDYRERPVEKALDDVRCIVEMTGDRVFSFESDVIRPGYLKSFCLGVLETGLEIKWHGVLRFEEGLDQSFFDLLARAGCIRIYFGLESGNARILNEMDKGTRPEIIDEILRYCNNAGIAAEVGVFIGYPGETPEEARDSLELVRRHRFAISRADAGFFRLLKGAPVVDIIPSGHLPGGKNTGDFWYTMEYENPLLEAHKETYQEIFETIEGMFPTLTALDISEEILYLARYGKSFLPELYERVPPIDFKEDITKN